MANTIEIVLKATDKTKGVFGKLGGSLADLGKTAIKGAAVGLAAVGTAAVAFGIKAVMAGADAEEMMSKLEATFGEASEGMISNLDDFAAATGRSRFELRGAATDMGAVLKALGATDEQASSMSASMTMLATDLGAFNNLPTEDVAHKIQSALTGEFESLKSLGVVINQAKLNQELLNMGIEGGTAAATDYQKALAIQNIIMAQTADAQGSAARESGSFTGQMVAVKAAISDATTEIGMKLLPVLTPLITKFAGFAADVLPKVVQWVGDKLIPALIEVGKWLGENVPKAIDTLKAFWETKLKPFLEGAREAFDKISGAVKGVIDWIKKVIDKLSSISLPSWLVGGSPSPFENTLRGIADEMKGLSTMSIPKLQTALEFSGVPAMAGGSPGAGVISAGAAPINFNFYDTQIRSEQDVRNLAYEVVELLKG